jgi:mRNA interferase RelE/StbE
MFAVALKVIGRILSPVENLLLNPRPGGCKTLQGGDREWRIRVGDYRVVYTIDDPKPLVEVTHIRHRRRLAMIMSDPEYKLNHH